MSMMFHASAASRIGSCDDSHFVWAASTSDLANVNNMS
jgi:hypothetical protein